MTKCKKLAQKENKGWRHDQIGKCIHRRLCQNFGFDCFQHWYDHESKPVEESQESKLLWDFPIQTDNKIEQDRPNILYVVIGKNSKERAAVIDLACSF